MTHPWFSRREVVRRCGFGLGSMALTQLLNDDLLRGAPAAAPPKGGVYNDLRPRSGHFPGRARAVIQLYQEGGPSQVDLFDPKPELTRRNGQPHPQGVTAVRSLLGPTPNLLRSEPCLLRSFRPTQASSFLLYASGRPAAARALAALEGDKSVHDAHLRRVAPSSLRHRLRRNPLDDSGSTARVERAIAETLVRVAQGRTAILITHRATLASIAHQTIYLDPAKTPELLAIGPD